MKFIWSSFYIIFLLTKSSQSLENENFPFDGDQEQEQQDSDYKLVKISKQFYKDRMKSLQNVINHIDLQLQTDYGMSTPRQFMVINKALTAFEQTPHTFDVQRFEKQNNITQNLFNQSQTFNAEKVFPNNFQNNSHSVSQISEKQKIQKQVETNEGIELEEELQELQDAQVHTQTDLVFVYDMVRHGARAPLRDLSLLHLPNAFKSRKQEKREFRKWRQELNRKRKRNRSWKKKPKTNNSSQAQLSNEFETPISNQAIQLQSNLNSNYLAEELSLAQQSEKEQLRDLDEFQEEMEEQEQQDLKLEMEEALPLLQGQVKNGKLDIGEIKGLDLNQTKIQGLNLTSALLVQAQQDYIQQIIAQIIQRTFKVPFGMLTPQGARQRYLLGVLNRQRYFNTHNLFQDDAKFSDVYIQSTDFYRTILSAYSQVYGMYKVDIDAVYNKTKDQNSNQKRFKEMLILDHQKDVKKSFPFKSRRLDQVNKKLGDKSVPEGFIPVPVFTYRGGNDGITCDRAKQIAKKYRKFDSTYKKHLDIVTHLKPVVQEVYGLSQRQVANVTFSRMCSYADNLISSLFEGQNMNYNFSARDMYDIFHAQKLGLLNAFIQEEHVNKLYVSKFLQKPFLIMDQIVNGGYNKHQLGFEPNNLPKYFMLSGHDTNIANIWHYFDPDQFMQTDLNGEQKPWYTVPYSSAIQVELHKKKVCKQNDCYMVRFIFNGQPIRLKGMDFTKLSQTAQSSNSTSEIKDIKGMYKYQDVKQWLIKKSPDQYNYDALNIACEKE